MNNLMILWRSWFLPSCAATPDRDAPAYRRHDQTIPATRAEILAILAVKSIRKEGHAP